MMLSRLLVLLCAALLGSACSAPASRTASAPEVGSTVSAAGGDLATASAGAATAEEADPLVCETVIRTGTRVAQRTCMRRSQIEKRRRDGQEALEAAQRRSVQGGNQTRE